MFSVAYGFQLIYTKYMTMKIDLACQKCVPLQLYGYTGLLYKIENQPCIIRIFARFSDSSYEVLMLDVRKQSFDV